MSIWSKPKQEAQICLCLKIDEHTYQELTRLREQLHKSEARVKELEKRFTSEYNFYSEQNTNLQEQMLGLHKTIGEKNRHILNLLTDINNLTASVIRMKENRKHDDQKD